MADFNQFPFGRKHSIIEHTHRIVNVIRKAFEEKKYSSSLDVSKAFDKVWHKILLHK